MFISGPHFKTVFCTLLFLALSLQVYGKTKKQPTLVPKQADCFALVTGAIKKSACIRIDFTALTVSDVFQTVDTVAGSAILAADKRYRVVVGPDWFLSTGDSVFVYTDEQKQLTVESAAHAAIPTEFILLRQLDDLYVPKLLSGDSLYQLSRKPGSDSFFPEKLTVACSRKRERLSWLKFRSENGDLVTVHIQSMRSLPACAEGSFTPVVPDGAEVVRLP